MGFVINIEGTFRGVDRQQLRDYVESVVTEAQGKAPQRVIFHTAVGQSPEERTRQLTALQSANQR